MSDNYTVTSKTLRLVEPGKIVEEPIEREMKKGWVEVVPTYASTCHADDRYFSGKRRPEALAKKLPMALLHEGIGVVKSSLSDKFKPGDRVVIVPGISGAALRGEKADPSMPANYDRSGVFMSSGYDGIAQSNIVQPEGNLVHIPDNVPDELAILTEVSTIGYESSTRVKDILSKKDVKVGVFGDGAVGYMAAAVLHYIWGIDKEHLTVFGGIPDRIAKVDFATTYLSDDFDFDNAPEDFDVMFEITGGNFSKVAINEAIKVVKPLGTIMLMGVSEDLVPIDTRDVLEKGLTLKGTSRSVTKDFEIVEKAISENKEYQATLRKLLPDKEYQISSAEDLTDAFNDIVANLSWHKAVLKFNW